MTPQTITIKKTSLEPPEFRGVKGEIIETTPLGYIIVKTNDGRRVVLHPDSVTRSQ